MVLEGIIYHEFAENTGFIVKDCTLRKLFYFTAIDIYCHYLNRGFMDEFPDLTVYTKTKHSGTEHRFVLHFHTRDTHEW